MLRLSRKTILALEAVLDVAYNARPDPVQSKDITRRQGIPQRYLEQVMQQLVHEGILKGVRGPRGGYTLARERRKITVGDVVRVVDQLDAEAESDPVSKADLGEKVIAPLWAETRDVVLGRLDRITMQDLCDRARELDIAHGVKDTPDFTI
jgi:Rrf2 family transcriptional regulator, iron-sulfur cluster assembly transcription factor